MGWEWQQGVGYAHVPYPPSAVWQQTHVVLNATGAQQIVTAGNQISAVIVRRREPELVTSIVLFLLCVVPFIVYLIVNSKDDRVPVIVQVSQEGDTSLVVASGPGAPVFASAFRW